MFSVLLVKDGIKVRHALADNDADTVIVQEALIRSKTFETVVHSVDTDVFNALLYHAIEGYKDIIMATKKGLVSIGKVRSAMSNDLRLCILFIHAISGCDTVSANIRHRKIKAYKHIKYKHTKSLRILATVEIDLRHSEKTTTI